MKGLKGALVFAQSGGPTSVINASAAGVFIEALGQENVTAVYGAANGIKGVLISDDMVMKGVQDYGSLDAILKGIEAGLDMFIFRNSDEETLKIINELVKIVEKDKFLQDKITEANNRILKLKKKYKIL